MSCSILDGSLVASKERLHAGVHGPMNMMLTKQNRDTAIQKQIDRQSKTVTEVPATTTVENIEKEDSPAERRKPRCSICKQPTKGHKNVLNCPKNIK